MKADNFFFDLPELLDVLGTHLTQGSLYRCIQVSKSWNATFLPHLWRTFTEEHIEYSVWGHKLTAAIQTQTHLSHELEWFKDVYRRHAKYILHLTINTPTMLDACFEGAFAPSRLSILPEYISTGFSGTTMTVPATTVVPAVTTTDVDVGGSLLINLESLTVNVFRHTIETYFPISRATSGFSEFNSFSTNSFGTSSNNTNNSDATTDHIAIQPYDCEQRFVMACQRLILNNPRLRTLSTSYFEKILEGVQQASSQQARHSGSDAALKSLKHVSYSSCDLLVPKLLPSSVTSLRLWCEFGHRSFPHTALGPAPNVHERLESLEVIYVKSCAHLTALLAQAPFLKTLVIDSFTFNSAVLFGFGVFSPVIEHISWPLSRVTVLECQQSRGAFVNKLGFDGFLKSFPMLVEYRDDIWYPAVAAQLVEHCPLLEIIRIPYALPSMGARAKLPPRALRAPIDDSVSSLLSSLSRLRVLDIPYESIKAETILETPWVCLELEAFRCQIAEVPFLTDEEEQLVQEIRQREAGAIGSDQEYIRTDEEDEVMELSEKCVSTRKSILNQLSKLTSLKFLSLSPDFRIGAHLFEHGQAASHVYKSERDGRVYIRYDDVLPDTLYFRLDNGLDQLASLTKLEYLSFESVDHRMETADIVWFANHLPRLKEMRGLVTENHVGMEPDPENDALVALIRRLRPDVAQRQTFGGYISNVPQMTASRSSPKTRNTPLAFRFRGSRPTNN